MPHIPAASYPSSIWTGDTDNIDRRDRDNQVVPDPRDWDRIVSEVIATQTEVDGVKDDLAGQTYVVRSVTINTTLGAGSEFIGASAASGNVVITLPAATGNDSCVKTIKKTDASANFVTINAPDVIDGESTVNIQYQWSAIQLLCTGSGWSVI